MEGQSFSQYIAAFHETSLERRVWPAGEYPCKVLPQIDMKPNFGVAISGGGMRAAALGLGWLRALNNHGLLTQARYVSVNSGASWVTQPLLWSAVRHEPEPTADMTTAQVDAFYKRVIYNVANQIMPKALAQNFGGNVFTGTMWNWIPGLHTNVWSAAVEKIFAATNKLSEEGNRRNTIRENGIERDRIREENYLDVSRFPVEARRLPFLIANGSVVFVDHDGSVFLAPFEFTPTYCGMPVDPKAQFSDTFKNSGGFIHPSVFAVDYSNSDRSVETNAAGQHVVASASIAADKHFKLSEIASISSSAIVEGYYESTVYNVPKGLGVPFLDANFPVREQYWSYKEGAAEVEGCEVMFADGAACDNSGILALLRRGVTDIIACCAIAVDIVHTDDQLIMDDLCDYLALFSRVTRKVREITKWEQYNAVRHVFKSECWDELINAMRDKRSRGEALVYTFNDMEVLANPKCGVNAYRANVTFVFNGRCSQYGAVHWEHLHPTLLSTVANTLNPMSMFSPHHLGPDFPIIPTSVLYYSEELVREVANIAEWSLDDGAGSFLSDLATRLRGHAPADA
jgi:hypothetical protein